MPPPLQMLIERKSFQSICILLSENTFDSGNFLHAAFDISFGTGFMWKCFCPVFRFSHKTTKFFPCAALRVSPKFVMRLRPTKNSSANLSRKSCIQSNLQKLELWNWIFNRFMFFSYMWLVTFLESSSKNILLRRVEFGIWLKHHRKI